MSRLWVSFGLNCKAVASDIYTFESGLLRDMEGRVLPRQSIFSITPSGRSYLVEGCNTVTRFKFKYIFTNRMNDASNIVA